MKGRYRKIFGIILICLSVLPLALRADGYQIADRLPYHASSVYYVTLQNAEGENINSLYATVDGALGAFVGDELRGTSQWQITDNAKGKGVFFIRVWGGKDDDDSVSFRLHDSKGLEYIIDEQPFAKDQEGTYGSPSAPIAMTLKPVTGISLPFTEITLKLGQTRSVQPSLVPEDHSTLLTTLKYTYSSDNAAVTVSDNGIVNTEAVGQAKVTVKATPGDFTAQATVKVEAAPQHIAVTEIKNNMTSTDIEMEEGDELLLDFSVLPEDATDKAVKFTNDYNIVGIKQETETSPVTIVAKKEGKAELTVISVDNEQATLTYQITVKKKVVLVTKIEVSPTTLNAYLGETYSFTLSILPENATNKNITASIEDPSIVDLDLENLTITAKAIGSTKIVFRAKDGSNTETTLTVTVSAVPVVNLSFAVNELTASKHRDVVLTLSKEGTADFLPSRVELVFSKAANGEPSAIATKADNTGLKWTVRGQYVGKHTVKIKYNGKEQNATCQLNIPAEYRLEKGWDWISLYAAEGGSISLKKGDEWIPLQLKDSNNRVVEIRSQRALLYRDPEVGFFGGIESLSPADGMYKFYCEYNTDERILLSAGYNNLVFASAMSVPTIHKGYTWVTYPHEFDHSFATLNDYLSKNAEPGDQIIGKDYFAEFNGTYWEHPALFHLQAGKGYIYYTEGNGGHTINWGPASIRENSNARMATSSHDMRHSTAVDSPVPAASRFAESMPVVAELKGMDESAHYVVEAFVDGECRGIGYPVASGLLHISVAGTMGETVSFRLVDSIGNQTVVLPQQLSFTLRAGSHSKPVVLTTVPDINDTGTHQNSNSQVYDLQGRRVDAHRGATIRKKGIVVVSDGCGRWVKKINK